MAEITYTRVDIRRAIGRTSRQEFFLRYGNDSAITADSDASTVLVTFADPAFITQDTDYWQNDWLYDVTLGEERTILNSSSGGGIDVEFPFSVAASSGDSFEIWGLWPPSVIHDAINRANRHSWRMF